MNLSHKLDQLHLRIRKNRWLWYFTIFNRVALAAGFLPSGMVKIFGERFTDLMVNHPMGNFLEAFFRTGYYYTVVGVFQVLAAVLLLIPRTATLGAIIYFPIILNICILSFSVRFDGSLFTSPLMVLANLYLLCWDYHKIKLILPFRQSSPVVPKTELSNKFPTAFFAGVFATVITVFLIITSYELKPRNTISDCQLQCQDSEKPGACNNFCECIHLEGQKLEDCLKEYNSSSQLR